MCGAACNLEPSCNGFSYDESSGACETSSYVHMLRLDDPGASDKDVYVDMDALGT